jgi:hypothetical protein
VFEKFLIMKKVQMQTINQKIAVDYLKFFYPPLRHEITQLSVQDNFAGIMQATGQLSEESASGIKDQYYCPSHQTDGSDL